MEQPRRAAAGTRESARAAASARFVRRHERRARPRPDEDMHWRRYMYGFTCSADEKGGSQSARAGLLTAVPSTCARNLLVLNSGVHPYQLLLTLQH